MAIRVLVPMELYSSQKLTGMSMVNLMFDIARDTVGCAHWYFVVPPLGGDFEVPPLDMPNASYLHLGAGTYSATMGSNTAPPADLLGYLSKNTAELPFDVIFNLKYCYAADIKLSMCQVDTMWSCKVEMPICTFYHESGVDKASAFLREPCGIISVLGGLVCGSLVVFNEIDKDFVLTETRNYLSSAMVRKALGNVHVVRPSVDWSLIDKNRDLFEEQRKGRKEQGIVHLFHGGTFEGKRHLPEVVELTERLHQMGMPVRLKLKTQWSEKKVASRGFEGPYVDVEPDVDREKYLSSLGEGDILMCAVDYEGTGLAYLEAVRSGMIGVFLNKPWIAERLPKDYPYVAGSIESMAKIIWSIYKNSDQAKEESNKLIAHWDHLYSSKTSAAKILGILENHVQVARTQDRSRVKGFYFFDPIEKFCQVAPERFTLTELIKGARDFAKSKSVNPASFGTSYLRRAVMECGYTDACDSDEIAFVRRV